MNSYRRRYLFIGTDNEGRNVFRFPCSEYVAFLGNMALAPAWPDGANKELAREHAQHMANDLRALSINVNFTPVVDVNTNPFNLVINVRSFNHAMISLTEVLIGQRSPQGKLLVNTWHHYDVETNSSTLWPYPRWFGLSW